MAVAYTGKNGLGQVVVYTTPPANPFRLDIICFTVDALDTASAHSARLRFIDSSGVVVSKLQDWNVAADGDVNVYTFGIGLTSSACTLVTGLAVEHDLPNTVLAPKTVIEVAAVDASGTVLAADSIHNVVLYGEQITGALGTDPLDAPPPLLSPTYA